VLNLVLSSAIYLIPNKENSERALQCPLYFFGDDL
jgi:hypothetical protein